MHKSPTKAVKKMKRRGIELPESLLFAKIILEL